MMPNCDMVCKCEMSRGSTCVSCLPRTPLRCVRACAHTDRNHVRARTPSPPRTNQLSAAVIAASRPPSVSRWMRALLQAANDAKRCWQAPAKQPISCQDAVPKKWVWHQLLARLHRDRRSPELSLNCFWHQLLRAWE